jgi:glycosyltransferase involved in cell wall biosynthesis
MKIIAWGTYDLGKPRTRILMRGLRENGVDLEECHTDVWAGVEDKSQVSGLRTKLQLAFKWLLSYPSLIFRYLKAPEHDFVYVGYLGQLDVLVLWPFARLKGARIIWDAFLSLYEMIVEDREYLRASSALAKLLFFWEWCACRAADRIVLDTEAHAAYFVQTFHVPQERMAAVFVGVEPEVFPSRVDLPLSRDQKSPFRVLFYGQFIPLHGIETIIRAAQSAENVQWIMIGEGQQAEKIKGMLSEHPVENLTWIPWVPYRELIAQIHAADVCLGIFGMTGKATRVIPNKIFQILSAGKPLITMESPAIRELLDPNMPGVMLVPPGNPNTLLEAVNEARDQRENDLRNDLHKEVQQRINPSAIGRSMIEIIHELTPVRD